MILTTALTLALHGLAPAQQDDAGAHHAPPPEPVVEDEADTASPPPPPPPPLAPVTPAAAPPVAGPTVDGEERFEALMQFRHQHLDIRGSTRWRGGGATVVHGGWGWGWSGPYHGWGWGWSPSVVVRQPLEPEHGWAVFQGVQRLSVPGYLEVVGDSVRLAALEDDLRRAGLNRKIGYGFGGAGLAATVVGFVAGAWSDSQQELMAWSTVTTAGICTALIGTLAGSSAASREQRLQGDFRVTVPYEDTRAQVDDYNEQLRQDLGLSKGDAYRVLTEQPPRRGQ